MNGFDVFAGMVKSIARENEKIGKTVILTKLEEIENPYHPNNKAVGYTKQGGFIKEPVIGEAFYVGYGFRTSTVKEILSKNTFKTRNSIYKWEVIEMIKNNS